MLIYFKIRIQRSKIDIMMMCIIVYNYDLSVIDI